MQVHLDLAALQAAARTTHQLPLAASAAQTGVARTLLAQLQDAAGLYRGDFLDGFSLSDAPEFDNWASVQREAWHRKATLVFDWLSQLQLDAGELTNNAVAPAVANAVEDAIGVRVRAMPVTAERVYAALQAKLASEQQAAAEFKRHAKELESQLRANTSELTKAKAKLESRTVERGSLESKLAKQLEAAQAAD